MMARVKIALLLAGVALLCVFPSIKSEDAVDGGEGAPAAPAEEEPEPMPYVAPRITDRTILLETFQDGEWKRRWTPSQNQDYQGEWNVEAGLQPEGIAGDFGLVMKHPARKHAIGTVFAKAIDNTNKDLVVQYEVRLQKGLECGGAYMKLLSSHGDYLPDNLRDNTPYTVMFGPDRCGNNEKVHFIVRSQNPVSQEYVEHHMTNPPKPKVDNLVHLYTLVVRKNNSYEIFIDGLSARKGSMSEDFEPPFTPSKVIPDPEDQKPVDWVDEELMNDPEAFKPDDWDDDAPMQILDMDANKPASWLDDEEDMVADPSATIPEDWDEEEDGTWDAPKIANPLCETRGCGEWKRPMKRNPEYTGKWTAPKIANPSYIGVWAPQNITNPDYFECKHPHNLDKMSAVAFELWTMQDGIMFDNILMSYEESTAHDFGRKTFEVKHAEQKKFMDAHNEKAQADYMDQEYGSGFIGQVAYYGSVVMSIAQAYPMYTVGFVVVTTFILLSLCLAICQKAKPGKATIKAKDSDTEEDDEEEEDKADKQDSEEEEEEDQGAGIAAPTVSDAAARQRKGRGADEDED